MRRITLNGGPLDGAELELEHEGTRGVTVTSEATGTPYRYELNDVGAGSWEYAGIVAYEIEHRQWGQVDAVQPDAGQAS